MQTAKQNIGISRCIIQFASVIYLFWCDVILKTHNDVSIILLNNLHLNIHFPGIHNNRNSAQNPTEDLML